MRRRPKSLVRAPRRSPDSGDAGRPRLGEAGAMPAASRPSPRAVMGLLVLACAVGFGVSLAAWCFLELTHQIQVGVFEKLPGDLGFDDTPTWWPLPPLALAGLLVAYAIVRLPGQGGH